MYFPDLMGDFMELKKDEKQKVTIIDNRLFSLNTFISWNRWLHATEKIKPNF